MQKTILEWFTLVKDHILRDRLLRTYHEYPVESVFKPDRSKYFSNFHEALRCAFTWTNAETYMYDKGVMMNFVELYKQARDYPETILDINLMKIESMMDSINSKLDNMETTHYINNHYLNNHEERTNNI